MNEDERRKLDNRLMAMGLVGLDNAALVPQLAMLIQDHEFFRGLLAECDPEKRGEMYEALRPHLSFEPKPLDVYMAEVKQLASAIASRSVPIVVGDEKYEQVDQQQATGVVITLSCSTCKRTEEFYGATPVSAVILARQKGWVRDRALGAEVCPKCPSEDRAKLRKCPTCGRRHYAPTCRVTEMLRRKPETLLAVMD